MFSGVGGMLGEPGCRKLASWPAGEVSEGEDWAFPRVLGHRDWVAQLNGLSFTSLSVLCSPSLCPREPLRNQGISG